MDSYLASLAVHAWEVDLRYEVDFGRSIGVAVAAVYSQTVDAVLMCALP
jgi:hypothetical protein